MSCKQCVEVPGIGSVSMTVYYVALYGERFKVPAKTFDHALLMAFGVLATLGVDRTMVSLVKLDDGGAEFVVDKRDGLTVVEETPTGVTIHPALI